MTDTLMEVAKLARGPSTWAEFIAVDGNGNVFEYNAKPGKATPERIWCFPNPLAFRGMLGGVPAPTDWSESLYTKAEVELARAAAREETQHGE